MPQICCLFVKGNLRSDVINKHMSLICGSVAAQPLRMMIYQSCCHSKVCRKNRIKEIMMKCIPKQTPPSKKPDLAHTAPYGRVKCTLLCMTMHTIPLVGCHEWGSMNAPLLTGDQDTHKHPLANAPPDDLLYQIKRNHVTTNTFYPN